MIENFASICDSPDIFFNQLFSHDGRSHNFSLLKKDWNIVSQQQYVTRFVQSNEHHIHTYSAFELAFMTTGITTTEAVHNTGKGLMRKSLLIKKPLKHIFTFKRV